MGAHAKDGQGPPPAKSAGCQSLVWCASPPVDCRAASDAGEEATWARGLLRDTGERLEPDHVWFSRRPHLAEVAEPSVAEEVHAVAAVSPSPRALPSPADDGHTLSRMRVAKPSVEEPDAAEPARPDLWGTGVSNGPGLPDVHEALRSGRVALQNTMPAATTCCTIRVTTAATVAPGNASLPPSVSSQRSVSNETSRAVATIH